METKENNEAKEEFQEEVTETSDETQNENQVPEPEGNTEQQEHELENDFTSEKKPKRSKAEKLAYALEQKKKWEAIVERYTKDVEEKEKPEKTESSFTAKEMIIINQAMNEGKLSVEDIDELSSYAQFKGISVEEALNDPVFQAIVEKNMEHRQAVRASNKDSNITQQEELTLDSFVEQFKAGKITEIEPGSKEAELMYEARRKKLI